MVPLSVSETIDAFDKHTEAQYLETAGIRYHIRTWGFEKWQPSEPLVVCLHGFKNNLYSFADLLPRLDRPALAFDFRGHGRTRTPNAPFFSICDYLLDLKRIVDHFDAQEIILIGHSLGARTATAWGAVFPERTRRLVLIEGLYRVYAPAEWPKRLRRWLEQADRPTPPTLDVDVHRIEQFLTRQSPDIPVEFARYLAERSCRDSSEGGQGPDWNACVQRPTPTPFDDRMMEEALNGLHAPTLALQRQNSQMPELKVTNRNVVIERLEAGHQMHWEHPVAVARLISRWLAE